MLFSLGFLLIFLIGGLTGVMVSVMPFDWQAHRHLLRRRPLPLRPQRRGRLPDLRRHLLLVAEDDRPHAVRTPRHRQLLDDVRVVPHRRSSRCTSSGCSGMPRRVYTYRSGLGWQTLNVVVTHRLGSCSRLGVLLTLANVVWSRRHGAAAAANPWDADTLEWATSSPPEEYNFARDPDGRQPPSTLGSTAGDRRRRRRRSRPARGGHRRRRCPGRCCRPPAMAAEPERTQQIPEPTVLPVLAATGVGAALRRAARRSGARGMDRRGRGRRRHRMVDVANR